MNFITLSFLIAIVVLLGLLSILSLVLTTKATSKKYRNILFGLGTLFFLLFVTVFTQGYVENQSNGARINKNGTITQYLILKNDTYTSEIKTIGKTTIKYKKDENPQLNKKITIKRSLIKGTEIITSKDSKSLLYDE